MADEKIVVVCKENCTKCKLFCTMQGIVIPAKELNKGDVVTIEIKRAEKEIINDK